MAIKVIHDTDIGSDIDDAVCLAYLLAQPECDLVGVTTVTGEVDQRAMLASALCKVAGKNVPIYPGARDALLIPQKQPYAPQAAALSNWDHDTKFPQGEAVEFLRRTIRQNPGEIVLLTTGPLTNAALLFKVDPEIPALLRGLVMMCGGIFTDDSGHQVSDLEWNSICDPHAAAMVYRANAKVHRSIGLQVTMRVVMSASEVRQKFQTRLLRPVLSFAEVWFKQASQIVFHDPLAGATIFDDQICRYDRGSVEVELAPERGIGQTLWTPSQADGPHEVAFDVDSQRFFEHFFSVFK